MDRDDFISMSEDIFKEWRKRKFVTHPDEPMLLILTDVQFWLDNFDDLNEFCLHNDCKREGMTVRIPNTNIMTYFWLRWA